MYECSGVGWLSPVESAALEMRYTRKGIVSSNLTPTVMSGEQIKFRPNIPEALREGDQKIFDEAQERIKSGAVKGSVDHDIEFFLIKTRLKNGQEVEQRIPRNSGDIPLDKKDKG